MPELSLAYQSQGANGLMGLGWSVRGLSTIHRCAKTLATDGSVSYGGIGFSANDQLCLDGERLMLSSGTHLAVNAEYRTEREIFSLVRIKQISGQAIHFEVWTKAGRILEYGGTATARLESGSNVESWHLSKITDRFGNYLTYTYLNNDSEGWVRPDRIDYTGNASINPAVAPYASVRFVYESTTRSDSVTRFALGYDHQVKTRLLRVETFLGATEVREYRLTYSYSALSSASRLTSITECAAGQCLPATTFTWPTSQVPQWEGPSGPTGIAWDASNVTLAADVRGVGVSDLVIVEKSGSLSKLKVVKANSAGEYTTLVATTDTVLSWEGDDKWLTGDVNGDGLADVLALHKISGTTRVLWTFVAHPSGNGTFTKLPASGSGPVVVYEESPAAFIGDLNGDGRGDLVTIRLYRNVQNYDEYHTYLSNGDGTWVHPLGSTGFRDSDQCANHQPLDANADGLLDIGGMRVAGNGNYAAKSLISDGAGGFAVQDWSPTGLSNNPDTRYLSNDANGDGLTDLIIIRKNSSVQNVLRTLFNKGDGTFEEYLTGSTLGGWNDIEQWIPADLDGNGAGDFIRVRKNGFNPIVRAVLADGKGGYASSGSDENLVVNWNASDRWLAGDAAGKGLTDLVRVYGASNQTYTQVVSPLDPNTIGPQVDQISRIVDGIGKQIDITYDSIARVSQGVYVKGSGAVYPKLDLQAAAYVVKQTTTSNLGSQPRVATHAYGEARLDLWGRGFLGYGTHAVADQTTGVVTTTTYRQDFPFEGFIASVESKLGTATLAKTTNNWVSVPLTNPNRQWVKLASSVEESRDANGSLVAMTETLQQFDAYANPTSVVVKRKRLLSDPDAPRSSTRRLSLTSMPTSPTG